MVQREQVRTTITSWLALNVMTYIFSSPRLKCDSSFFWMRCILHGEVGYQYPDIQVNVLLNSVLVVHPMNTERKDKGGSYVALISPTTFGADVGLGRRYKTCWDLCFGSNFYIRMFMKPKESNFTCFNGGNWQPASGHLQRSWNALWTTGTFMGKSRSAMLDKVSGPLTAFERKLGKNFMG